MSKEPSLAPIINKLLSQEAEQNKVILEFISKSPKFDVFLEELVSMTNTEKGVKKSQAYNALLDVILAKSSPLETLSEDKRLELLNLILAFPEDIKDFAILDKINKVLKIIFDKLTEEQHESIESILTQKEGKYSIYAFTVYQSHKKTQTSVILKKIIQCFGTATNFLDLAALALFFESNKLENLDEEGKNIYNEFGGENKMTDFLKPLLISSEEIVFCCFKIIRALFQFLDHNSAVKIFLDMSSPITDLLSQTKDPEVKIEIAKAFAELPSDCSTDIISKDAQLRSYLKILAANFESYDSEYIKYAMKFIEERRSVEAFSDIVYDLFGSSKTSRAAIYISFECNVYESKSNIIDIAFPTEISDMDRCLSSLDVIPVIIKDKKLTKEVFIGLSKFVIAIITNKALLGNEAIGSRARNVLPMYLAMFKTFPKEFSEQFMDLMINLDNINIVLFIAKELVTVLNECGDARAPFPDRTKFIEMIIHLFPMVANSSECVEIMSTILKVYNSQVTRKSRNFADVIDDFVRSEFYDELKTKLFEDFKKSPIYAVLAAYMPSLNDEEIKAIVNVATTTPKSQKDDDEVNPNLFNAIFMALSTRYLGMVFDIMLNISTQKEKGSFLFFGKKEKNFQISVKRAILNVIPQILKGEEKISEELQEKTYKIITAALPTSNEMKECAEICENVIDVFPLLKNATAPDELLEKVVAVPLFAESLPYIITTQKKAGSYAELVIKSWLIHLSLFSISTNKNPEIAKLIFRISPNEATLETCIVCVIKYYKETDVLPFINFALECFRAAQPLKLTPKPNLYVDFFIETAHLCLSYVKDIRYSAFHSLMVLFNIPERFGEDDPLKEIDLELSPEASICIIIKLFGRILNNMKDTTVKILIDRITDMKQLSFQNALILRAALEAHGTFILKEMPQSIMWMFSIAPTMNKRIEYHINVAMLEISQRSMKDFIHVLFMSSNLNYKRKLVGRLLKNQKRRIMFFEQFNNLICSDTATFELFQIMPAIIHSEDSDDIPPREFGFLLSSLIIWLTGIYTLQRNMPRTMLKTAKEEIAECFSFLFQRSNIACGSKLDIKISTFNEFNNVLKSIVSDISKLDIERINSICVVIGNMICSSNENNKIVAGIIFINLQSLLGLCTNLAAVQLSSKLLESISVAMRSCETKSKRLLCSIINDLLTIGHLSKIKKDHASIFFLAVIESLGEDCTDFIQDALDVVSLLLPLIPSNYISQCGDAVLAALRMVATKGTFSMQYLELLEEYIKYKVSFADFARNIKLNIIYIMDLLNHDRQDVRDRAAAILELLVNDLENSSGLSSLMSLTEVASFGLNVVSKACDVPVNKTIIKLVKLFSSYVSAETTSEAIAFKEKAIAFIMNISDDEFKTQAMELLPLLL